MSAIEQSSALPPVPDQEHTPNSTKWDIHDERGDLDVDRETAFHSLCHLGGVRQRINSDRVCTRGSVTRVPDGWQLNTSFLKLASEKGTMAFELENEDILSEIDEGDVCVLTQVRRDVRENKRKDSYVIDDETGWSIYENCQRFNLLMLSEINGRGFHTEYVGDDTTIEEVHGELTERRDALSEELSEFPDVEVSLLSDTTQSRYPSEYDKRKYYIRIKSPHRLLPKDIQDVYNAVSEVGDAIRWAEDTKKGTQFLCANYQVEMESNTHPTPS